MGAWIEMYTATMRTSISHVAPLVGAWIEILFLCNNLGIRRSLLSWERGLKLTWCKHLYNSPAWSLLSWERGLKCAWFISCFLTFSSLLSWERGLKYHIYYLIYYNCTVAPLVGAWIEIVVISPLLTAFLSLLSWERGLKSQKLQ